MKLSALSFFCALLVYVPVGAAAQDSNAFRDRIAAEIEEDQGFARFLRRFNDPSSLEALQGMLISEIFRASPDGRASSDMIDVRIRLDRGLRRAQNMMSVLKSDLNADGKVDAAERAAHRGGEAASLETVFASGDTDRDGVLTIQEITQYADRQLPKSASNPRLSYLMLFDFDKDGFVTSQDVTLAIDVLAADPVSASAPAPGQQRVQPRQSQTTPSTCTAPKPANGAKFLVVSAYEGAALSTVAINGPNEVTEVATLEIEPGESPLFLLVAAHESVIWDVTGAIDRIQAFVVQGGAVMGLSEDVVHFVPRNACFGYVSSVEGGKGALAYRAIEKNIGAPPNVMLARYTLSRMALPSGTAPQETGDGDGVDVLTLDGNRFEVTPEGLKPLDKVEDQLPGAGPFGAAQTLRSMMRFHSGGLREIDPESVLGPGEVEAYDVYPQEAGLLQLVLDGRLRYTRDGYYVIAKDIPRFPAGLFGAHSVRFILADDVGKPQGTPGHSSVVAEATGECLAGVCRR